MHWYPVVLLCTPEHVAGAEIIISALTEGYVEYGAGFAHCGAGISTNSHAAKARHHGEENKVENSDWDSNFQWILRNTPYEANTKRETELLLARASYPDEVKKVAALQETIADFDREIAELNEAWRIKWEVTKAPFAESKAASDALRKVLDEVGY